MIIYDIRPPQKRRTANTLNLKGDQVFAVPKISRSLQIIFAMVLMFLLVVPFGIWPVKKANAANTTLYVNTASTAGGNCSTNSIVADDPNRACPSLFAAEALIPADITIGDNAGIWTIIAEGEAADTQPVVFSGTITDADHYIVVTTDSKATYGRHSGVWSDSKYRLVVNNGTAIDIRDAYVRLDGLQLANTDLTGSRSVLDYTGGTFELGKNRQDLSNTIIKGSGDTTYSQYGISGNASNINLNIWNVIVYNIASVGSSSRGINAGGTTNIYNSTVVGGYYGIARASGTLNCKNTYAGGSTNGDYYGTINKTTCASSDSTGSTGLQSIAVDTANFKNVSAGSEDYRLPDTGSALYNTGTNTSGESAPLNFTTDIKNITRPSGGYWDIGADELFVPDTMPPLLSGGSPSGTLARATTATTLSVTTNESATCKYSTVADTAYAAMTNSFSTANGLSHTADISGLLSGQTYNYYVRCQDTSGNTNTSDYTITFKVSNGTATSCSLTDVQAEISVALAGETVSVPAGSCTWTSSLTITKGITLQGAGIGNSVITGNVGSSTYLVIYQPANLVANEMFRLTGFTFDLNNDSRALYLKNTSSQYAQTQIRVDHNSFLNNISPAIEVNGPMYGVIDNNTFTGSAHFDNYGQNTCGDWSDQTFSYGSANNLYYEDNIFLSDTTATTGGHGGRYVWRYNTFTYTGSASLTPWFDMHGNQPSGVIGPRGGEIYGNEITSEQENVTITMIGHRGGQMLIFNNKIGSGFTSASAYVSEEYDDSISCNGAYTMHVNNSYYWNNRYGSTLISPNHHPFEPATVTSAGSNFIEDSNKNFNFCVNACYNYGVKIISGTGAGQFRQVSTTTPPSGTRITVGSDWDTIPDATSQYQVVRDGYNVLEENREYFNQNTSFDGTKGIGAGPLSSRPSTCTTGVGYWATNQTTDSVSDANIGANPSEPISGTLYKCTSTNKWEEYYTPYTYPHPLRTYFDTPPIRSAGSPSGSQSAGTTQVTLSLTTDKNATCKYSTSAGTAYASMTGTFSTTGGTFHSSIISGLSNGKSYNYYVRCTDGVNINSDDYTISFSIASPVSRGGGSGVYSPTATAIPVPTSTTAPSSTTTLNSAVRSSFNQLVATLRSILLQMKSMGITLYPEAEKFLETSPACPVVSTITKDLTIGSVGAEVKTLQEFLNCYGFTVAATGPGSTGNETTMFGPLTQQALAKFQSSANISPAAGYFGAKTRAYLRSIGY